MDLVYLADLCAYVLSHVASKSYRRAVCGVVVSEETRYSVKSIYFMCGEYIITLAKVTAKVFGSYNSKLEPLCTWCNPPLSNVAFRISTARKLKKRWFAFTNAFIESIHSLIEFWQGYDRTKINNNWVTVKLNDTYWNHIKQLGCEGRQCPVPSEDICRPTSDSERSRNASLPGHGEQRQWTFFPFSSSLLRPF